MRLVIVSHTPHHLSGNVLRGWASTVREIDELAGMFDQVVHVAPLHKGAAPESDLAYRRANIRVRTVPASGGESLVAKLGIIFVVPRYLWSVFGELRKADVVHVRSPAGLSLVALMLLMVMRKPRVRWVKYAGNWKPTSTDALTYRIQRWYLRHNLHRGMVTVNGEWADQEPHVISFDNPCFTRAEFDAAATLAAGRKLERPLKLLFAGRVDEHKGADRFVTIVRTLLEKGLTVEGHLIGDGPLRRRLEEEAPPGAVFHGWMQRTEMGEHYRHAHFLVLPSRSEGWPKVVTEAMAYGAVPVATNVADIARVLSETGAGIALDPEDTRGFSDSIESLVHDPERWEKMSRTGVSLASRATYESYLAGIQVLLRRMVPRGSELTTRWKS